MLKCVEIIAYSIKRGKLDEFHTIKNQLIEEARSLDGLISSVTLKSADDEDVFLDKMEWKSKDHAEIGRKDFMNLPTSKKFMSLLQGPPMFTSRFEEMLK